MHILSNRLPVASRNCPPLSGMNISPAAIPLGRLPGACATDFICFGERTTAKSPAAAGTSKQNPPLMEATIQEVRRIIPPAEGDEGVFQVRLQLPDKLDFKPGQVLVLKPPQVNAGLDAKPKPWYYAIASVPGQTDAHGRFVIDLCVKRSEGQRNITRLQSGDTIQIVDVIDQGFSPPPPDAQVILVGTGLRVAPLLSILRSRMQQYRKTSSLLLPKTWLFAGYPMPCDILYPREMRGFERQSSKYCGLARRFHFVPAFSRVPGLRKTHVQDQLLQYENKLWPLLNDSKTVVYLCGGKEMVAGVERVVRQMARTHRQNGQAMLDGLKAKGRWQVSSW